MSELCLVLRVVVHHGESNVRLRIDPHSERVPIGDQHPLSDIKFLLVDYQWIFNILLNDPISPFRFLNILQNVIIFGQYHNTTASARVSGLNDPQILIPIHIKLAILRPQFLDDTFRKIKEQRILSVHIQLGWIPDLLFFFEQLYVLVFENLKPFLLMDL